MAFVLLFGSTLFANIIVVLSISATGDLACDESSWTHWRGEWEFSDDCSYTNTDTIVGAMSWIGESKSSSLDWTDYTVEATLNPIWEGKGDTGLAFHVQEVGECEQCGKYYAVSLLPNVENNLRVILAKWNNDYTALQTWDDIAYDPDNMSFHLKVTILNGADFKIWLNDQYLGEYTDEAEPVWTSGSIGIRNSNLPTVYQQICVNGCVAAKDESGMSDGWIFITVLLVGFFAYCFIGYLINGFKGKNWGDVKANLPQCLSFWIYLPRLVKTGCAVSCEVLRGTVGGGGNDIDTASLVEDSNDSP